MRAGRGRAGRRRRRSRKRRSIDESALTGEPLPLLRALGGEVRSGSANAGDPFDLRATRPAAESAYAGIVRLVQHAETERAPFVRMADRYAAGFLPFALAVAGGAWAASGSSTRFLAVMVVATPCPLILAAPIAFIAGVSRAAHRGVIVKSGGVIERLGEARSVLLDKTGTLTLGLPAVERVVVFDGLDPDELLRLAASVDQVSAHVLAEALVHEAEGRGVVLVAPEHVHEGRGQGVEGTVEGRRVAVGSSSWLHACGYAGAEAAARSSTAASTAAARGSSSASTARWPAQSSWATTCGRTRTSHSVTSFASRASGTSRW